MDKKKFIIIVVVFAFVFSAGFFTSQSINKRTISSLNSELVETANRIETYKDNLNTLAAGLGESEDRLKIERDRNREYIQDIERLEIELSESELRNRKIIDGVTGVQDDLGGIAFRANSSSGLVDGCLRILESAEDY